MRWADGTQVCWVKNLTAKTGGTGASSNYAVVEWTFPASFIDENVCAFGILRHVIAGTAFPPYHSNADESGGAVNFISVDNKSVAGTQNADCIAIGRWKE